MAIGKPDEPTENIILLTDSYKVSHWPQYPPGTSHVYSYFMPRGGRYDKIVSFSLQYFLKKYLEGRVVTPAMIDEAEEIYRLHFGSDMLFNRRGWEHILAVHGGRLPVSIKAVPEGTVVDTKNVLMTIENTDPSCYWLTNYLETLLVQVWYGTTVATQSYHMKKIILDALNRTGTPSDIAFKLHDFGFRGVSSVESSGVGGAAHLVNFMGTDTVRGVMLARKYYGEPMAGFSVPAAEHSTITSWGMDREVDAFDNMLTKFESMPVIAVVSDSFDIFAACGHLWGRLLKEKVMKRNGVLVVRPDSGRPEIVVPEVLRILGRAFGFTINQKGFKVLDPHVRVIQGDGISIDTLPSILNAVIDDGWSADNIAFGSGGGLLQQVNRDTSRFAFKCSSITVNGEQHDVFKNPVTDSGKASLSGRLKLIKTASGYQTVRQGSDPMTDQLEEVFRNGSVLRESTLAEIRVRASEGL